MGARGGKPPLPLPSPPSRGEPARVEAAAVQSHPSPDHEVRLPPRQRRPRAGACGGAGWRADRAAGRTRRGGRRGGLGTCRALAQTRKTTTTRSLRLAVMVATATASAMALTAAVTSMVGVGTSMVGTGLTGRARPNRLGLGFSGRCRYRSGAVEFAWAVGVWRDVNVGRVRLRGCWL